MTMIEWQRRGQAAYERALAVPTWFGPGPSWDELPQNGRAAWCAVAEAAFEEGRAFEREQRKTIVVNIDPPQPYLPISDPRLPWLRQ